MRIISGLSNYDLIGKYYNAWVDEFFVWFLPFERIKKYVFEVSINRRYVYGEQIMSKSIFSMFIKKVHYYKKEIFLTLNEQYYTDEQIEYISLYLKEIKKIWEIDWIIVANMIIMDYLNEIWFEWNIHLSWDFWIYNIETLDFILNRYKNLKIDRLIFPRETSLKEIEVFINYIKDNSLNIETEAFILESPCVFNWSSCRANHWYDSDSLCQILSYTENQYWLDIIWYKQCWFCFIKKLKDIWVDVLKVPWRWLNLIEDIRYIKELIISSDSDINKIQNNIKNKNWDDFCNWNNCYYNLNEIL